MSVENENCTSKEYAVQDRELCFRETKTAFLAFHHKNEEIGRMEIKDGKLTFTGNVDESARLFFDRVIALHSGFMSR